MKPQPRHDGSLIESYFRRLELDSAALDTKPTLAKLRQIQEAHVSKIPFENLAQHGCPYPATVCDVDAIANKVLDKGRGGFCFELNGLLSVFLEGLGYKVTRAPAYVALDRGVYRDQATHMILMVDTYCGVEGDGDDSDGPVRATTWLVDVAFGEPPIHPLRYDLLQGEEQLTPEGMRSKIIRDGDNVVLWWLKDGEWKERLRWSYDDSLHETGRSLSSFRPSLSIVLEDSSVFSKKLIVCLCTRERKVTVAGNRLKITSPRFSDDPPCIRMLQSEDEARLVLQEKFRIPLSETEGLDFSKSCAAEPGLWSHF
jgi:N-hydroxyarylamine O-acetyltransferase